ncbi:MAG: ORF6N domain-containing protein [archaeon]
MIGNNLITQETIKYKIYKIRNIQVMLDSDLAELYGVSTMVLNQAVKRNLNKFPADFMFQLTQKEFKILISQFVISSWGGKRKLPYAFTEQGIASLSGILKSERATEMNIQIMRTFVSMRKFISRNVELFEKINYVESKQIDYQLKSDKNFKIIFDAIENKEITKKQGIFFDGQVFDAHNFVSNLIRSAKTSIILIDNYIDDTVLTLFTKINKNVKVTIYTKNITKQLKLDLEKYNSQYNPIIVKKFKKSHDRFLIIDNKDIYHIGASIKDLGKKWFAFAKLDSENLKILEKLNIKNNN